MFLRFLVCSTFTGTFVYLGVNYTITSRLYYIHYYRGWNIPVYQILINRDIYFDDNIRQILDRIITRTISVTIEVSGLLYNTRSSTPAQIFLTLTLFNSINRLLEHQI